MVIKLASFGISNPLYKQVMQVRRQVFVEEVGLEPEYDFDGLDDEAVHFLLMVDEQPAGAARWRETKEGVVIERLSIVKKYRGLGLGTLLLRYVVKDVLPSKRKIYLLTPDFLVDFFRWNGFEIEGEKFQEAGTDHYKMVYQRDEKSRKSLISRIFGKK